MNDDDVDKLTTARKKYDSVIISSTSKPMIVENESLHHNLMNAC